MRKIILAIGLVLILSIMAYADPVHLTDLGNEVKNLPLRQGIVYSIKQREVNHASTAVLFEKGNFGVEAGYIDNGKLLGAFSYKLIDLKKYVSIPLVKELEFRPGVYVALDEVDTSSPKVDYGLSCTLLTFQF